ncbi:MAG: two-component regulator propeller domain-containing protein [Hyphomicrobiales bacterium]
MRNVYHFFWAILFMILSSTSIYAQSSGIGTWSEQLSFKDVIRLAEVRDKIYCATTNAVFYYDQSDNSIGKLTKVNGLNDFGIVEMGYSKKHDALLIVYQNANIDILHKDEIINLPDIKIKENISNKKINSLFIKDDIAYLECGFGIVLIDLAKKEVEDTWKIGDSGTDINVNDFDINDTAYLAAINNGIKYCLKSASNPADYKNWSPFEGLPKRDTEVRHMKKFGDDLLISFNIPNTTKDTVYIYKNGEEWIKLEERVYNTINKIQVQDDVFILSCNKYTEFFNSEYESLHGETLWYFNYKDGLIDKNNNYWSVVDGYGLLRCKPRLDPILPSGPYSNNIFDMKSEGDNIYIAPGGHNRVWSGVYNKDKFFYNKDGEWINIAEEDIPEIEGLQDFVTCAVDPSDPDHVFFGTWGYGVVEFKDGKFVKLYNQENSSLEGLVSYPTVIHASGLDFDSKNNLWAVSSGASNVISKKTPSGEWESFNLGSSTIGAYLDRMMVDKYDQKWIIPRYGGIIVVSSEDSDRPNDIKRLGFTEGSGGLPGSNIYSVATDHDGEVWVGTDDGVGVFYSPQAIFQESSYDASRITVDNNGDIGYLLAGDLVSCITVDGSNQKWFGTDRSGVIVVSADGKELIHKFTMDNSPLPSNKIMGIAITKRGEVFIGTDKGMMSYMGEASTGGKTNEDIYVYPNPVRPEYSGNIAINGLVQDAKVKITDVNGNLVFSGTAKGGQFIWNGKTLENTRVNSGIYLVFVTDDKGEEKAVTKMLFMK